MIEIILIAAFFIGFFYLQGRISALEDTISTKKNATAPISLPTVNPNIEEVHAVTQSATSEVLSPIPVVAVLHTHTHTSREVR